MVLDDALFTDSAILISSATMETLLAMNSF